MKIRKILVETDIQEKILWKHGIKREEFENALLEGNPRFFKIKDNLYMAITHYENYLTILFEYDKTDAIVKTAYKSSDWQIKRYNKK